MIRNASITSNFDVMAYTILDTANMNTAIRRITFRLIPDANNVRKGPEMATTRANTLTSVPACDAVILNFRATWGRTPTIPISVVIMPKTPKANMIISKGFTCFCLKEMMLLFCHLYFHICICRYVSPQFHHLYSIIYLYI